LAACGDNRKLHADARAVDSPVVDTRAVDSPVVDTRAVDSPVVTDAAADASIDAPSDAATMTCEVGAFCGCGTSGVCGSGTLADRFRRCDVAEDTCIAKCDPCTPLRGSVEPDCCLLDTCPPAIQPACGGATSTCGHYGGSSYEVPDGTPCDDGH